jgi:hypothetical protein
MFRQGSVVITRMRYVFARYRRASVFGRSSRRPVVPVVLDESGTYALHNRAEYTMRLHTLLCLSSFLWIHSLAFVVIPSRQVRVLPYSTVGTRPRRATLNDQKNDKSSADSDGESQQGNLQLMQQVFPVVSQMQGINWEGTCRYVNSELQPQNQLKLTGGTRFDLDVAQLPKSSSESVSISITSFLVFPDGRTRQVQMKGIRSKTESRPSTRLDPVVEGNLPGPIYMVLTEVGPDTILLNEVERESGRIILTTTLSLVPDELIQSSHEIGTSRTMPLEGHQLWRFRKRTFSTSPSSTTMAKNQDSTSNSNSSNSPPDDETKRSSGGDRGVYRGTTGR